MDSKLLLSEKSLNLEVLFLARSVNLFEVSCLLFHRLENGASGLTDKFQYAQDLSLSVSPLGSLSL